MKKIILLLILLVLSGCREPQKTVPNAPTPRPDGLTVMYWNPMNISTYSDGTVEAVLGYKIHCNSNIAISVDVGNVIEFPLKDIGTTNGSWICYVTAYDVKGETGFNSTITIINDNGYFTKG
jgi:hypothetical protein